MNAFRPHHGKKCYALNALGRTLTGEQQVILGHLSTYIYYTYRRLTVAHHVLHVSALILSQSV